MCIRIISIFFLITLFGCEYGTFPNDSIFNDEIDFTIADHFAEQNEIAALCVTDNDNYCYASGSQIILVEDSNPTTILAASAVLTLALDKKTQTLWFGTQSSGLGRYKNGKIHYFTMESDGLPRNLIHELIIDDNGYVWFSSSAHLLGGICCIKDDKIEIFTPENSDLPDNLIKSITSYRGVVYVSTGGTVTQQKVVEIDGNRWKILPITGYYLMDMTVDSEGRLYFIDDTGLSSTMMAPRIWMYDNGSTKNICPEINTFAFFTTLVTDLRNYVWLAKYEGNNNIHLTVYDGFIWHDAPSDFPDVFIRCMAVDHDNNLWLGTEQGIYLLNQ